MKIEIRNRCTDFNGYRAARVKSLFNVETGADFSRDVDLSIEGTGWKVGLVVGPSGSGKTSIGRRVFADLGDAAIYQPAWAAAATVLGGLLAAYALYDIAHLAAHGLAPFPFRRALARYHARHHRDATRAFGVTSPLVDALMGTR